MLLCPQDGGKKCYKIENNRLSETEIGKWLDQTLQANCEYYYSSDIQLNVATLKTGQTLYKISPQRSTNLHNMKPGREKNNVLKFEDLQEDSFDEIVSIVKKMIDENRVDYFLNKREGLTVKGNFIHAYAEQGTLFLLSA